MLRARRRTISSAAAAKGTPAKAEAGPPNEQEHPLLPERVGFGLVSVVVPVLVVDVSVVLLVEVAVLVVAVLVAVVVLVGLPVEVAVWVVVAVLSGGTQTRICSQGTPLAHLPDAGHSLWTVVRGGGTGASGTRSPPQEILPVQAAISRQTALGGQSLVDWQSRARQCAPP